MKLEWTQTTAVSIRHTAVTPIGTYSAWVSGALYFEGALLKRTVHIDAAKMEAQRHYDAQGDEL